jgi:hypothetical protein
MKLFDRSTWVVPGRIVDVLSIAVAAFAIVIFLRPVSQFIYFQF